MRAAHAARQGSGQDDRWQSTLGNRLGWASLHDTVGATRLHVAAWRAPSPPGIACGGASAAGPLRRDRRTRPPQLQGAFARVRRHEAALQEPAAARLAVEAILASAIGRPACTAGPKSAPAAATGHRRAGAPNRHVRVRAATQNEAGRTQNDGERGGLVDHLPGIFARERRLAVARPPHPAPAVSALAAPARGICNGNHRLQRPAVDADPGRRGCALRPHATLKSYVKPGTGYAGRPRRWSARRKASATMVSVGLAWPAVGNTELPAT